MDIPSTGPQSLRSNYTDDTDEQMAKEEDLERDRFTVLTSAEELSQATLITWKKNYC